MRLRACVSTAAFLSVVSATAAFANLDTDISSIERDTHDPAAAPSMRIPLSDLAPLAGSASDLALDMFKNRADAAGNIFYAANEFRSKSDVIQTAAVADVGPAGLSDMNVRFYGSLLIFAAGCMMWLGLAIRRNP